MAISTIPRTWFYGRLTAQLLGLILTANTELKIAKYTSGASSFGDSTSKSLAPLIPPLLSAVESQSHPAEDVFQCRTCLAWIHWLLSEPGLAASRLPKDIAFSFTEITKVLNPPSEYLIFCMLKSVYMKVIYKNQEGDVSGSLEIFKSVLPWVDEHTSTLSSQPQLLLWSEQLFAHMTLAASDGLDVSSSESDIQIVTAWQAFKTWAIFIDRSNDTSRDGFGITQPIRKKFEVWKAYYLFLSELVQHGIDHHALGEKCTRDRQVAELRRVESIYETELLRATRFPKAHESNRVFEEWVEQVIRNWEVLCSKSWPDAELGEGGRNSIGRNVLDILYRAAQKTFHSTLILRRLFQVHKSLADFSLAYKALESYLELITRGKARAEKSQESPTGMDDDETLFRTISEGIEGLATFGRKEEAEKAFRLAQKLEEWIKDYSPGQSEAQINHTTGLGPLRRHVQGMSVGGETLEISHRAIGIGKAFWAFWTPVSERRSTFQSEALASLKQATVASSNAPVSLHSTYTQAFLLAETRDLKKAIDCVKGALITCTSGAADNDYAQRRKTMPLWHLLALLLSARQDFTSSYQVCTAAFNQFPDLDVLFGHQSASLNGVRDFHKEKASLAGPLRGLVEEMDGREIECIVEIRMTELALLEIVEGAEEAVNSSNELLSLFSRLFGHLSIGADERPKPKALAPPKSSAGTMKSLRGSILGRRRHEPPGSRQVDEANGISSQSEHNLARHSTGNIGPPMIQVTDEETTLEKQRSQSFRGSHSRNQNDSQPHKLHKREGSKPSVIRRHSKINAPRTMSSIVSSQTLSSDTGQDPLSRSASTTGAVQNGFSEDTTAEQNGPTSSESGLKTITGPLHSHDEDHEAKVPVAHDTDHAEVPQPPGHPKQPPQQDVRLPVVYKASTSNQPSTKFPQAAEKRHAHGVLMKIWLFIAGLYRRASLFEDSKEACDEASRSASQIEALVAAQESSAAAFADPGWGGGKSSNEAWADVHVERALLALAEGKSHEAMKRFEEALMYSLDHPRATVGLSNILLDIYEQKVPGESPRRGLDMSPPDETNLLGKGPLKQPNNASIEKASADARAGEELRKTPENLSRLAARDRAYGLLSNLTKLGSSWDDSEAWYALARAHECGGQIEKAKEVLWWCVELEDTRPVRHWRNIGPGSYVL